ncbi:LysR substrate-binding domain-containing protein [Geodermatophilus marinus]|uniref:LysR substrate-binding domain-containing protein n=1 Tax=Geodermatophilus sp. LHW52908 TaxID=2303986 RepID=UPI000E3CC4DF|nr:LysR substrate-binding domain-containing protein [Geodermatophilus sp. LHW52908]RFU20531.1 LysR family transcriptional regulator [Geodermatophilus sp. LHW52908]
MAAQVSWGDLRLLELIVSVSEHGSLGAGARAVGMAQPNASRAVARFERASGVRVLRRSARGSTLTPEGALVVDWARGVLDAADRLSTGLEALRAGGGHRLGIAASMTVAEYLVPVWLAELRRHHPEVRVALAVQNSAEVAAGVAAGGYDVGFVESPELPGGLHRAPVGADELVVVVHPGHPWARRRAPVPAAELAATPLVVRETGSGTRTALEAALGGPAAMAEPALALTSNAAVRLSVVAGGPPAVLSALAVAASVAAGELHRVPVTGVDLRRELTAVWAGPRRLDGEAGDLVRIAQRRAAVPRNR